MNSLYNHRILKLLVTFLSFLYSSHSLTLPYPKKSGVRSQDCSISLTSSLLKPSELIPTTGVGGNAYSLVSKMADLFSPSTLLTDSKGEYKPVNIALQRIQKDMRILDEAAGNTAQLTSLEIALLSLTVIISGASPLLFSMKVVELLVPSMAALSAAVGISAGDFCICSSFLFSLYTSPHFTFHGRVYG